MKLEQKTIITLLLWITLLSLYTVFSSKILDSQYFSSLSVIEAISNNYFIATACALLLLSVALLIPFSSAALIVLLLLPLLGPSTTFIIGILAGSIASVVSYLAGKHLSDLITHKTFRSKILDARSALDKRPQSMWMASFLSRAIPNPLYDVWGYAFGAMGIPMKIYVPASIAGGVIPLAIMCYLPEI